MRHFFTLGAAVILVTACGGTSYIGKDKGGSEDQDSGTGGAKGGAGGEDPGPVPGDGGKPNPGSGGTPGGGCADDGMCAAPAVCKVCPDGTYSCASGACVDGECQVFYPECDVLPGECRTSADCGAPPPYCEVCADGTTVCPGAIECLAGKCVAGPMPTCAGSCNPLYCAMSPERPEAKGCCLTLNGPCGLDYGSGCVPSGTGAGCTTSLDCPVTNFCPPCPDGSCAPVTAVCIAGECSQEIGSCGPPRELRWYTTCGYPVCGPEPEPPVLPPCDLASGQKAGEICLKANEACDPGLGCGARLLCAADDPTGGGNCPLAPRVDAE